MKTFLPILITLLPTLALAQAPSTSVIPYSGTLFSQGKPVSQPEAVQMAFALYSGDAVTALPAGNTNEAPDMALADESPSYNRLWTSWTTEDGTTSELSSLTVNNPHTVGVIVRNGRFLVHLGALGQTALPDSVFDQRPLYVVTWVVNANGVFRLPAQRLEKVPHAVTAERATNFDVQAHLQVKGNVNILGNLNFNNQTLISSDGGESNNFSVRLSATDDGTLRASKNPESTRADLDIGSINITRELKVMQEPIFKIGSCVADPNQPIALICQCPNGYLPVSASTAGSTSGSIIHFKRNSNGWYMACSNSRCRDGSVICVHQNLW